MDSNNNNNNNNNSNNNNNLSNKNNNNNRKSLDFFPKVFSSKYSKVKGPRFEDF